MNWDAIGAIGEVVGAIAVVVTLIALIFQLRENTKAIKAQSVRDLLSQVSQSWFDFGGNPYFPEVMTKSLRGEDLTDVDKFRLRANLQGGFLNWQIEYYQLKLGSLDDEFREAMKNLLTDLLVDGSPWKEFWLTNKKYFTREFQIYVDDIMSRVDVGDKE